MAKVSLCMIVKNEESILEECLESIKDIPDEIIITDTGSTDLTVEIAKKYTDKIYHFKWIDDFSAARNFCTKYAQYEYVMTWDADNILLKDSLPHFLDLKTRDFDGLDLVYGSWHTEVADDGSPIKTMSKPIIYKKETFHWESPIHNMLVFNKGIKKVNTNRYYNIEFSHYKDKEVKAHRYKQTAKILKKALAKNYEDPRLLFFYGESLIFDKKYDEAEKVFLDYLKLFKRRDPIQTIFTLEKLMFIYLQKGRNNIALNLVEKYLSDFKNNPRFVLTYADCVAANNLNSAKKYYENYLKNPVPEKNENLFYDLERFAIHPRWMLANIYIENNELTQAKPLLKYIIKYSALQYSKKTAKLLLAKITV